MLLIAVLFALPLFAQAEDGSTENGWYVGVNAGALSVKGLKHSAFEQSIIDSPQATTSSSITSRSPNRGILAGYNFNRYLAAEVDYSEMNGIRTQTDVANYNEGTITVNGNSVYIGNLTGDMVMKRQARLSVTQFSVIGKLPVANKLDLFAKAGLDLYKLEVHSTVNLTDGIYAGLDDSQRGRVWVGTVGADYKFTEHFSGRFEYMPGKVIKTYTVGVIYRF